MQNDFTQLAQRAAQAREHFSSHINEKEARFFVVLKKERPDWVYELTRHAHWGMPQDDFRMNFIQDAIISISDAGSLKEAFEAFGVQSEDLDKSTLIKWLSSNHLRTEYVDRATQSEAYSGEGIMESIAAGFDKERREVFSLVLEALGKVTAA